MKFINLLILVVFFTLSAPSRAEGLSQGSKAGISFWQAGKNIRIENNDDLSRVSLSKAPFDIHFTGGQVIACAWTDDSVFQRLKSGSDSMKDFSSCAFIYKSLAMDAHSEYLYLSRDSGNAINTSHGAQALSGDSYTYTVGHFKNEGKGSGVVELGSTVYLVMWIDRDNNKIINEGEFDRFRLDFK